MLGKMEKIATVCILVMEIASEHSILSSLRPCVQEKSSNEIKLLEYYAHIKQWEMGKYLAAELQ